MNGAPVDVDGQCNARLFIAGALGDLLAGKKVHITRGDPTDSM